MALPPQEGGLLSGIRVVADHAVASAPVPGPQ